MNEKVGGDWSWEVHLRYRYLPATSACPIVAMNLTPDPPYLIQIALTLKRRGTEAFCFSDFISYIHPIGYGTMERRLFSLYL